MRFIVSGNSMKPAYGEGQSLLVSGIPYLFQKPTVNDVVIVKDPRNGRLLLKRIKRIEDNMFFVAGDNEKASTDSRTFGAIERKSILGKVL